ncbi:tRNA pseudouridine(55) synthase TruB [Granulicoccus phenolivorans]|uniref:tRNA pseudouridine(55) synthase TruB n=1 Tax=Granulicoccus phenolivorans TaxID=266854 RepID=UPI00041D8DA5|nr:tRNA pseudouridine(55) synthase TruB [Granulicoccus phenolivorans]
MAAATGPSGVVVVDKPAGWTSHQVVGRIRRLAHTRKVGHAGTLDPMATGVLLIGVNRATRLLGHLMLTQKEYTATIRLGRATITDDAEGEFTASAGAAGITREAIEAAMVPLRGEILQVPTAVSAIKVNGQRAYAKVRAGEDVELRARPVTVSRFDLGPITPAQADGIPVLDCEVAVTCSSGTYIRALARDLGRALGSGGHLTALRRTRVGPFDLSRVGLDETGLAGDDLGTALIGIDEVATACFPHVEVTDAEARAIGYGQPLPQRPVDGLTAMMHAGRFLALYRPAGPEAAGAVAEAVLAG